MAFDEFMETVNKYMEEYENNVFREEEASSTGGKFKDNSKLIAKTQTAHAGTSELKNNALGRRK